MELKEGMYVRTDEGEISKIEWFTFQRWEGLDNTVEASFWLENKERLEYPRDNFKASNNIIDLIEEGDYVNGYYVEDVLKTFVNVAVGSNYFQSPTIYEEDIKSIVTKEQFYQISYNLPKDK